MFICRINSKLLLFSSSAIGKGRAQQRASASFQVSGAPAGQARPGWWAGSHGDHRGQPGARHQLWASGNPASSSSHRIGGGNQSPAFSQGSKLGRMSQWHQARKGPREGWATQGRRMWFPDSRWDVRVIVGSPLV